MLCILLYSTKSLSRLFFCEIEITIVALFYLFSALQLRERMGLWHTEERYQRIGDVIVKFSPFFKMYTEYVKNFDNAIHTINTTYAKNSKFSNIMDIIHVSYLLISTLKLHNRAKVVVFCKI